MWDGYLAEVGEVPLELVQARAVNGRLVLEWEWSPEFFTGEFAFMIRYRGARRYPPVGEERRLAVRPDFHKLTRKDYEAMLSDLVQWTSGWLAPSLGHEQGAHAAKPSDSPLAQLELLHRGWPMVERLVADVLERPRHKLVHRIIEQPLYQVQTLTGGQWRAATEQPARWNRQPSPRPEPLARLHGRTGGLLPRTMPQTSAYSTLAVPENIFVITLLTDVRFGLMRAIEVLEGMRGSPDLQREVARSDWSRPDSC